jgi:hypothetical protein
MFVPDVNLARAVPVFSTSKLEASVIAVVAEFPSLIPVLDLVIPIISKSVLGDGWLIPTRPVVVSAVVVLDNAVTRALPDMSNEVDGEFVPIPTSPAAVILIRSVEFVPNTIGVLVVFQINESDGDVVWLWIPIVKLLFPDVNLARAMPVFSTSKLEASVISVVAEFPSLIPVLDLVIPFTSNRTPGALVPIPTLPLEFIIMRSAFAVLKRIELL